MEFSDFLIYHEEKQRIIFEKSLFSHVNDADAELIFPDFGLTVKQKKAKIAMALLILRYSLSKEICSYDNLDTNYYNSTFID